MAFSLPLAVLALALWVRADPGAPPFQGFDDAWLGLMGSSDRDGPLWTTAVGFDRLGGWVGRIIEAAIVIVLLARWRWRSALFFAAALVAGHLVTEGFKLIGQRPRPADRMIEIASLSFPSGHASHEAAFVVALAVVAIPVAASRWWWPAATVLVLAMMWSRTWLHAHWPSDTIGGVATGIGVALLCWWAFSPLLDRERKWREGPAHGDDVPTPSTA
ncbi:phosphatase PAP2 family protein [Glycomyces buryatensis]|uniref:phosphatase PAP2 family protein n=1 Tax=Glycomyces buryatensis TaxID=2570927 RepID=UPI0010A87699|nr:phosphatase PAP2 family protein [Glycomyces buryatensis]